VRSLVTALHPVALAALVVCGARPAAAAGFDAAGELSYDPSAVYTTGFETPADAGDPDAGDAIDIEEDDTALEGTHVLRLGQYQSVGWDMPLVAESRSFRGSVWARGEVVATLEVVVAGRSEDFGVFYPTGRMTSDGWIELALHDMTIDAARAERIELGVFAPSGADVDALEIVPDGDPVLGASCSGADDKAACADGQLCNWGRCRNYASRVPALPPAQWRGDLVDYLDQRFQLLFGPFLNRAQDLPAARVEIDAMRSAGDAWSFWRHFGVAVNRLHDWHTRGSDLSGYIMENPHPIAVCLIEGTADLSQSAAPSKPDTLDVMVSHVGTLNTFGLKPGDRLVSVDKKHPVEWARSLIGVDYGYDTASNHTTNAESVARLNGLIAKYAEQIEVVRCDAAAGSCASTTETLHIADLPEGPPGESANIGCDNRPILHVPVDSNTIHPLGGVYSGIVNESDDVERIYGLQWSSLYVTGTGGVGQQLTDAVNTWRANARGVILDHRTGYGGTTLGSAIIWDFVRPTTPLDYFQFRQRADETAPTDSEGKALFDELAAKGQVESAGSFDPALDVPVALLTHLDGSASDWLPLGLKGSPKAKVFAPYQTAGAFSTLFGFGYWLGVGYSIAVGDTLFSDGTMLNGHGVEPDVVVLPLESDLVAGKDTVYDTALAWVRQELKP
jgi:Peptidase family S41